MTSHRVALLAQRCPSCGMVVLHLHGRTAKTINLASAHTVRSALIDLGAITGTGPLVLQVTITARLALIDMLAIRSDA